MAEVQWGMLGHETVTSTRRTRSLGLTRAVRDFNERAVPGLGGVWFGKQLFLALLGICIAQQASSRGKSPGNIATANAIEALACWLAYQKQRTRDPRLRGSTKLQGLSASDMTFSRLCKPGSYVSQPMRMTASQPLRALGLVGAHGVRFNSYKCSEIAKALLNEALSGYRVDNRDVLGFLNRWVETDLTRALDSTALIEALSPCHPLNEPARKTLRVQLFRLDVPGGDLRKRAMQWVETLDGSNEFSWSNKPTFMDETHWRDLHAGASFFQARDAAIDLLDSVENAMGDMGHPTITIGDTLKRADIDLERVRTKARDFLALEHDRTPERIASKFCRGCTNEDPYSIVQQLVSRDSVVLRLDGDTIKPGAGYRGSNVTRERDMGNPEQGLEGSTIPSMEAWPEGISPRIENLYYMVRDLEGRLDDHILGVNHGEV